MSIMRISADPNHLEKLDGLLVSDIAQTHPSR
jgi:hypothetical protein